MLEAAYQGVDGKAVMPGRDYPFECRWVAAAAATEKVVQGQWQRASAALLLQPGQRLFAGEAQGIGLPCGLVAEQTGLIDICTDVNQYVLDWLTVHGPSVTMRAIRDALEGFPVPASVRP